MASSEKVKYLKPSKVVVNYSGIEGIGVFATEDINEGDVVERCPMVKLAWRSNYIHDPSIWKYCYGQPRCDCSDCKNHGGFMWMVLGYGMIYNHQDIPNTKWVFNYDKAYADVIATKPITGGQEIFVSYGTSYWRNRKKIDVNSLEVPKTPLIDDHEDDEIFMAKVQELMSNVSKDS